MKSDQPPTSWQNQNAPLRRTWMWEELQPSKFCSPGTACKLLSAADYFKIILCDRMNNYYDVTFDQSGKIEFLWAFTLLVIKELTHRWLLGLWRSSHPLLVVAHRTWPESGLHENINIFAVNHLFWDYYLDGLCEFQYQSHLFVDIRQKFLDLQVLMCL